VVLSLAATGVFVLILFYRRSPAVFPGISAGIVAAIMHREYLFIVVFGIAGGVAVFLYYRRYCVPLNHQEWTLLTIKTGLCGFMAYHVATVVLKVAGIIQVGIDEGFPSLRSGFLLSSFLLVEVLFICLSSILGGFLTILWFRRKESVG